MKIYEKLLFILFFTAQLGCSKQVEKYDLSSFIESKVKKAENSSQPVKLGLCNQTSFKWDKIVVLKPYATDDDIQKHNLTNADAITGMSGLTSADWMCVLLFVENNTVIRYSNVNFSPLDFTKIGGLDKTSFTISRKMACEQLSIKKNGDKFSFSY